MPSTPVSQTQIDCRQCQIRLTSSAPVTPTVKTPNQSIVLNESIDSNASDTSFDFRTSANDSLICNPSTSASVVQGNVAHPICTKCSNMELENSKTKTKLDQLRLVLQQRRERREARKMRSAPYGGRIIGTATATATTTSNTNANDTTSNGSDSLIQKPVDGLNIPIVEQTLA